MTRPNGGPAFPLPCTTSCAEGDSIGHGMSLRDYFAGQALIAAAGWAVSEKHWDPAAIAEDAYAVADALLEARKAVRP